MSLITAMVEAMITQAAICTAGIASHSSMLCFKAAASRYNIWANSEAGSPDNLSLRSSSVTLCLAANAEWWPRSLPPQPPILVKAAGNHNYHLCRAQGCLDIVGNVLLLTIGLTWQKLEPATAWMVRGSRSPMGKSGSPRMGVWRNSTLTPLAGALCCMPVPCTDIYTDEQHAVRLQAGSRSSVIHRGCVIELQSLL